MYGSHKLLQSSTKVGDEKRRRKMEASHFKNICELLCNGNLQNTTLNYAMTKTIYVQQDNLIIIIKH